MEANKEDFWENNTKPRVSKQCILAAQWPGALQGKLRSGKTITDRRRSDYN